nr:MAG TPA: hypothetical protein [Caudoviricetes sp.]
MEKEFFNSLSSLLRFLEFLERLLQRMLEFPRNLINYRYLTIYFPSFLYNIIIV